MPNIKPFLLAIACCWCAVAAVAQELNCQVRINTPKLQTTDVKVFRTLETGLKDLMNTRQWGEDAFKAEERINCTFSITIKEELSSTSFKADFAILASRPVYGSTYETVLMNYVDKDVTFDYQELQSLDFNELTPASNITALMGYYAYIMLGMTYDTFSPLGGSGYLQKAQNLVNAVPTSFNDKAWRPQSADHQRSRYWIIENLMNPRAQTLRKAMYDYHLKGLDLMYTDPTNAYLNMATALEKVGKANADLPGSQIMQIFADAKGNEILQVFSGAKGSSRNTVYEVMTRVDGANAAKYGVLQGGK